MFFYFLRFLYITIPIIKITGITKNDNIENKIDKLVYPLGTISSRIIGP